MINKLKVKLLDKTLIKNYLNILSIISMISSLVLIFVDLAEEYKIRIGICFVFILIIVYLFIYISANRLNHMKLVINNSQIDIYVDDIFAAKGYKVIAFNEYFDTIVDNNIISTTSLNGKYILEYYPDVSILDKLIIEDEHASKYIAGTTNRTKGKQIKYNLGTIVKKL